MENTNHFLRYFCNDLMSLIELVEQLTITSDIEWDNEFRVDKSIAVWITFIKLHNFAKFSMANLHVILVFHLFHYLTQNCAVEALFYENRQNADDLVHCLLIL